MTFNNDFHVICLAKHGNRPHAYDMHNKQVYFFSSKAGYITSKERVHIATIE